MTREPRCHMRTQLISDLYYKRHLGTYKRHPGTYIRHPGTYVRHPGTYIRRPISISDVRYLYPTSDIQYLTSDKGWARARVRARPRARPRARSMAGISHLSEIYIGDIKRWIYIYIKEMCSVSTNGEQASPAIA